MNRVPLIKREEAREDIKPLFDKLEEIYGGVGHMWLSGGHSPEMIKQWFNYQKELSHYSYSPQWSLLITLAASEISGSKFCIFTFCYLAEEKFGLSEEEINNARLGKSNDPKLDAMLKFSQAIVQKQGWTSEEDFQKVKNAGLNNQELVEVYSNTMNAILVNWYDHIFEVHPSDSPKDYPSIEELKQKVSQ